jgi:hypothetical protein
MFPADRELHDDTGPVRRVYAVRYAVRKGARSLRRRSP